MPIIRALCVLPMDSNIPEDSVTNTFHFDAPLTNQATELAGLTVALQAFYSAVDQYLSQRVSTPGYIRYYDLSTPTPRAPLDEDALTFTTGTGLPLPSEVAICMSFQGAKLSGSPQARRRGRIFLGPLDVGAAGSAATTSDRPATTCRSAIATAGQNLEAAAFANGTPWVVYSPTDGDGVDVTNGWVDDAFDTQRRRGVAATTRTTWA